MNAAHLHLLLNHIPILGSIFCAGLLIFGIVRKNESLQRTALWTLVLVGLISIATFVSGEPAEEVIENIPGVSHDLIHAHEDLAKKGFILIEFISILAIGTLYLWRKNVLWARRLMYGVAVLLVVEAGIMFKIGETGGEITHSELKSDAQPIAPAHHDD